MAHRAISSQEASISKIRDYNSSILIKSELDNTNDGLNKYVLNQNYPNPFNPLTTIEFSSTKSEIIILKVYDIVGKEIAVLVNEEKPAGTYRATFDGSSLTSGVYFYKIQIGAFTDIKKLILLK